jgi:hypothetical protein
MTSLYTLVSSYLYETPTKSYITFSDEKTSESVELDITLMKTLTTFFDDNTYSRTQQVKNANNYKKFFDYVHNQKTITNTETCIYHKYAIEYKMDKLANDLRDNINKFDLADVLQLHNETKFNGLDESVIEQMIKLCISDVSLLCYEQYFKLLSIDIIKILLTRENYFESRHFALEKYLLDLVILYFKIKCPEETKENKNDFMDCIDKLRFDVIYKFKLVSLDNLMHVTSSNYYKNDIFIQKEIDHKIVRTIANKHDTDEYERQNIKFKDPMTFVKIETIKDGDILDMSDMRGHWFVGKVANKKEHETGVSFSGWSAKCDETIYNGELRIAKLGTFTNGKLHDATKSKESCDCMTCKYVIKVKIFNDLSCTKMI